jgi:hypothetical protein
VHLSTCVARRRRLLLLLLVLLLLLLLLLRPAQCMMQEASPECWPGALSGRWGQQQWRL